MKDTTRVPLRGRFLDLHSGFRIVLRSTVACFLGLPVFIHAQPGSLDLTFAPPPAFQRAVTSLALQMDGRVLAAEIVGGFDFYGGKIERFNVNGSIDLSYTAIKLTNSFAHALALDDNGKLLLGGSFTNVQGQMRSRLARLTTDRKSVV